MIVTPVAPLSSNWERACELYAQLTSGRYVCLETNYLVGPSLSLSRFTWFNLDNGNFDDDPEGIDIDYGDTFPAMHGYDRLTTKRKTPVVFTRNPQMRNAGPWVWNEDDPVHFICHSQGGNTVRYLLHLMEHGSRGLTEVNPGEPAHRRYFNEPGRSKWAISVSTIGTPHRGTTVVDSIRDFFRVC